MRVAVVGMGGSGSAAAYWLARAGQDVTAFEQFEIGHVRGSSHGESRVIRYTYSEDVYTHMMGEAYPLWQQLEQQADEELLVRTGGVFFGAADSLVMAQAQAALDQHCVPYSYLTPEETHRRFPALRLAAQEAALYQPDMGFLRATACVLAQARLARAHGATVREKTAVQKILPDGSPIRVITDTGEEFAFDRVIVTAGPWMVSLFSSLDLPLHVTRQQISYLQPDTGREQDFEAERLPVWIDADANIYGFPADGRIAGVKMASHAQGEETDPDTVRRQVDNRDNEKLTDYAARRFYGLTRQINHTETCLYANTPDEDFLIDTVPNMPQVWLVSGCSGHGFKFTVLLGKIAAEAATLGVTPPYLSRFSLRRFAV